LCLSNEELRGNFISEREHQHHGGNTAGKSATQHNLELNTLAEDTDRNQVELKGGVSDFMVGPSDNKQIVPYGTMSNDVCDESSVVFGALHRLRLSRSDIIRYSTGFLDHLNPCLLGSTCIFVMKNMYICIQVIYVLL